MKLKGKVAIITGGTRGIGKGIALEFVKEGATVVLNYLSDDNSANETLKEIEGIGGNCILSKGNISNYTYTKGLIANTINRLGKIDILVNNAAISRVGLFMDETEESYNEIMDINFKSVFNTCNCVIGHMLSRREGSIINISSVWGNIGASCEVLYSASKGAMNSFTKALGKETAPNGVRVNGIAPGVIDTKMNRWMSEEEREALNEEIPMGRFGYSSEIGRAAVFLACEESSYITGEILNVNGGF